MEPEWFLAFSTASVGVTAGSTEYPFLSNIIRAILKIDGSSSTSRMVSVPQQLVFLRHMPVRAFRGSQPGQVDFKRGSLAGFTVYIDETVVLFDNAIDGGKS